MKRILLFILAFVWFNSQAQKAFEGTLFIEVVSADSSEIPKMNFEVKLKGSMARMNIHSENIDDYSLIINYETGESVMLKTHNGEKIAVRGMKTPCAIFRFVFECAWTHLGASFIEGRKRANCKNKKTFKAKSER